MDPWALDRWAQAPGLLQRATPLSKLVGAALAVAALAFAEAPVTLAAIALGWLALMAFSRLPLLALLRLAGYAALFAALYALSSWEGSWGQSLALMLKAVGSALAILSVVGSTPYPVVFQSLQPLLPPPLPDALLLTYRSLFLLVERWDHLWIALRLRGGIRRARPWRSLENLGACLAILVLDAMDRSEALYDAMLLRGYRASMAPPVPPGLNGPGLCPLFLGGASLALAILRSEALSVLAIALAAIALGLGGRR
ncbi:MAG TPA: energy-coupling factor transporter transmembrane component T [Pantanalinema sp.]